MGLVPRAMFEEDRKSRGQNFRGVILNGMKMQSKKIRGRNLKRAFDFAMLHSGRYRKKMDPRDIVRVTTEGKVWNQDAIRSRGASIKRRRLRP